MQRKAVTPPDDAILIHTNPTHLDRVAGWIVLGVWLYCAIMAGFGSIWLHIPLWVLAIPLVAIVITTATVEAATDIEGVGAFSGMIRARMGQRSAFEWFGARLHYLRLVELPAGRATCERYFRSLQQRTRSWRTIRPRLIRR